LSASGARALRGAQNNESARPSSEKLGFPWLLLAFLGFQAAHKPRKAKVCHRKAKLDLGFAWLLFGSEWRALARASLGAARAALLMINDVKQRRAR
jgi:hypothetical protein